MYVTAVLAVTQVGTPAHFLTRILGMRGLEERSHTRVPSTLVHSTQCSVPARVDPQCWPSMHHLAGSAILRGNEVNARGKFEHTVFSVGRYLGL